MPGIGLKVFPSKVANHHADVLIADSVLTAKRVAGLGSTGIGGTDGLHIQGSKFCVIVLLAARGAFRVPTTAAALASRYSSFVHCVLAVVLRRSQKQVVGADTMRVVASMANVHPVGDRAVVKLVGNTMSAQTVVVAHPIVQSAVATVVALGRPKPTTVGHLDLSPKAVRERSLGIICVGAGSATMSTATAIHGILGSGKRLAAFSANGCYGGARCGTLRLHSESPIQIWDVAPRGVSAPPRLSIA